MAPASAGILLYRREADGVHVLLTHPGGPFWRNRDEGAWTIPKGVPAQGEAPEAAARREFGEELGQPFAGTLQPLARIRQRGGKWVDAFTAQGDFDTGSVRSNMFLAQWPPRSGRMAEFPEVDRAAWFPLEEARRKILPSQLPLLDALEARLAGGE